MGVLNSQLSVNFDRSQLTSPTHLLLPYCILATLSILLAEQCRIAFVDFRSLSIDSDLFWRFNAYCLSPMKSSKPSSLEPFPLGISFTLTGYFEVSQTFPRERWQLS